jgi:arsenical pump membrane protein
VPQPAVEIVAVALLLAVLAFAVTMPRRLPEVVVAGPAAVVAVAVGAVPLHAAVTQVRELGPTVAFLAAVLVLAQLCDAAGVFTAAGRWTARACRGNPRRLLTLVFAVAALTTAVLSLDATVVLLTPAVFATAATVRLRAKPHVYACTHLANSASLLLPVSNLTNLIALRALQRHGVTFVEFAALMALPWLVVLAVEYAAFRRFFAADLGTVVPYQDDAPIHPPVFALAVVAATLLGFGLSAPLGVDPAWVAAAGAVVLGGRLLFLRRTSLRAVLSAANVAFLVFVLALGVVVAGVERGGLGSLVRRLLPSSSAVLSLLAIAVVAAVLANLVNNLPAILVLLPTVAAATGPGPLLAALIGVNVGPNLTYVGSLATLLWRRILHHQGVQPALGEFLRLGLLTVPPSLVGAVLALWAGLHVIGGSGG